MPAAVRSSRSVSGRGATSPASSGKSYTFRAPGTTLVSWLYVIGVAATDNNDNRAGFSNYGLHTVSLGAPGQSVYSTYSNPDDGFAYLSGTSMAAPHVAGLAGLVREVHEQQLSGVENLPVVGDVRQARIERVERTSGLIDL